MVRSYLCVFICSVLECSTDRAFCFKESCLDGFQTREELMSSNELLEGNQTRGASTNDSNTHEYLLNRRICEV